MRTCCKDAGDVVFAYSLWQTHYKWFLCRFGWEFENMTIVAFEKIGWVLVVFLVSEENVLVSNFDCAVAQFVNWLELDRFRCQEAFLNKITITRISLTHFGSKAGSKVTFYLYFSSYGTFDKAYLKTGSLILLDFCSNISRSAFLKDSSSKLQTTRLLNSLVLT
jgi:hypothetical protein